MLARLLACLILACGTTCSLGQERFIVTLRNGMQLGPGLRKPTDSVSTNAFARASAGEVVAELIDSLDDGWRKTYYNASPRNIADASIDNRIPFDPIKFAAADEVERNGAAIKSVTIRRLESFKPTGRRTLTVMKGDKRSEINVLQQITELNPQYAVLELLRGSKTSITWQTREPITSIPSDQLYAILTNQLDLSRPSEWLRMYDFYVTADRYNEALVVLEEAIKRFPFELGPRKNLIAQTYQLYANKQFEEIAIRRNAGQWRLASELLGAFDNTLLESQISAKKQLDELREELQQIQEVTQSLQQRVQKLSQADQQIVQEIIQEIVSEINVESAVRFDDYIRLSLNNSEANENMVSLAIGGWLMGPGSGLTNFAVAKSLIKTRSLVREYLNEASIPKREYILNQIKSEEAGQPQYVAKIIVTMKPPLALNPHQDQDPPGLHRQQVQLADGESIDYVIQLPPEYDPNRKYPCILALPPSNFHFQSNLLIDYWCGVAAELPNLGPQRFGAASRYGYIVISPNWMTQKQRSYEYTEGEKHRILSCYRDALRRTSIDSDKAFITGHFEGATAAWDIVQSHPDLWAGAVMISPTADKYIIQYHENLRASKEAPEQVPPATYIVLGQFDDQLENFSGITSTADKFLKDSFVDCMLVQYIGHDRGIFAAEVPRIFQWMQLPTHQRLRAPRYIDCISMRAGDRFFYWLEAPQMSPDNLSNAFEFEPTRDAPNKGRFEANLLDSSQNAIRVSKVPSADRSAIVWLTPEMVDFGRDVTIIARDKKIKHSVSGRVEVMLEDVRTRGDRVLFYWDSIRVGGGK